jgi:hypothetical protein
MADAQLHGWAEPCHILQDLALRYLPRCNAVIDAVLQPRAKTVRDSHRRTDQNDAAWNRQSENRIASGEGSFRWKRSLT